MRSRQSLKGSSNEESAKDSYDLNSLAESIYENLGDKKWAKLLEKKAKELEDDDEPAGKILGGIDMKINFKKLKKDMDEDKDFLHWDTDEKVSITCIKFPNNTDWKTNYRVSVESNQDEDTSEYDVYGEFGSSIDEIESAVECFLENGGDIISFQPEGYLNAEKIFIELKKIQI